MTTRTGDDPDGAVTDRTNGPESYPVQVSALLSHDANGDNCRALFMGRIAFSLVPLRDAYRRAYRTDSGAVAFTLRPSTTRLVYRF